MQKISALEQWLNGENHFKMVNFTERPISIESGGFLSLDVVMPTHESGNLTAESLRISHDNHKRYIQSVVNILDCKSDIYDKEEPFWINPNLASLIREKLGPPPPLCYPIYMITIGENSTEKLVYLGKTSSNHGRFANGHSVHTKLLNPKYDGKQKRTYLCTVGLRSIEFAYTPLELVQPLEIANSILSSIESQLIHCFKPEFNKHHTHSFNGKWPICLNIENFTEETSFLNGMWCLPPTTQGLDEKQALPAVS